MLVVIVQHALRTHVTTHECILSSLITPNLGRSNAAPIRLPCGAHSSLGIDFFHNQLDGPPPNTNPRTHIKGEYGQQRPLRPVYVHLTSLSPSPLCHTSHPRRTRKGREKHRQPTVQ